MLLLLKKKQNDMTKEDLRWTNNLKHDLPAALVVFLVALPLCLGIALASGAPLFSGIISGVIGGIVIGALSKSPLSVSGPAAGLAVIVLGAIQSLPSFEVFLLAVVIAGVLQIAMGLLRAGMIGDFIPSAVIKGMLAAIGLILILKQFPHALGYDADFEGDEAFFQSDGGNTFSTIWYSIQSKLSWGAVIISSISLSFLFFWDSQKWRKPDWLKLVPGPLVVVAFGVIANLIFHAFAPSLAISEEHMVRVPVADSMMGFFGQFAVPDFSYIFHKDVWIIAFTLALVASIETLLCIEAIDKIDPFKRTSPTNRELIAQGVGNIASGLIGGIPVTSVIVRSSANATSGGRTRMSTILHGVFLLISVIAIPQFLNMIPLSALAAILISVGYKLTKPAVFKAEYEKGWSHLIPFVVTVVAILFTDLLVGVLVGLLVGAFFIIRGNYHSSITLIVDGNRHLLRFYKDLSFVHKFELKRVFDSIPEGADLLIDLSRIGFIDLDNAEIINDYLTTAKYKDITVSIKLSDNNKVTKTLNEAAYESV